MKSARSRRRVLAGLTVTTVVATASFVGANAFAAPTPELPPISEGLASLLGGPSFESKMIFVHAENAEMAEQAADNSGMRRLTTFEKVGIVLTEADESQVQAARTEPGVTYLERADDEMEFKTDTAHDATRGKETATIYNGSNDEDLDGTGVTVAVIDSGIDGTNPSFPEGKIVNNLKCVDGVGVTNCTSVPNISNTDTDGHGTAVAGSAAGAKLTLSDGTEIQGAAPGANLVSLSISLSEISILTALNWVLENHAAPCGEGVSEDACPAIRVVNNSYGPSVPTRFEPLASRVVLQRALVEEGVAVVWAAGNDGRDDPDGEGPAQFVDPRTGMVVPNDFSGIARTNPEGQDPTGGVVSVGAFNDYETGVRDDPTQTNLADFSSRGLRDDSSTWPDISAPGVAIRAACTGAPCDADGADRIDHTAEIDGTSFSAPIVAGAIAQLFQLKPFSSPADIEDAVKDGAFKFDSPGDNEYVRVDSYSSSFDKGTGLLDVMRSADAVQPE